MSFKIKPAVRQGIRPLIGLSGVSGGGKTRSALLLARGLVGPKGRITLIDSETGRGSIFADRIPGGYSVLDLDEPFTAERYEEAFRLAEANSDIVVQDSISHEWQGVLEAHEAELDRLAGNDHRKRDQMKFTAWIKPKAAHKDYLTRILRAKVPVICCFRAEPKTRIGKDGQGKTVVRTSDLPEPIFDPRFFFEMLVCADVYQIKGAGGYLNILKITHEDLYDCLPNEDEQLGIKHGELIAVWCQGKTAPGQQAAQPTKSVTDPARAIKAELWKITQEKHQGNKAALAQFLWDENLMSDTEALEELTTERLAEVLAKTKEKLANPVSP